jgi:branched-chain amino acid transport system permease protein
MFASAALGPAKPMREFPVLILALLAVILLSPFFAYPVLLMEILCYALFACAFNLLFGYVGLMSFGHAAFFAAGSYAAAWAINVHGVTPEIALAFSIVVGVTLGTVYGALSVQMSGMSFAMVTLALAQMLSFILLQAPFTHGENGLINSERGSIFGVFSLRSDIESYAFTSLVFLAGFLLTVRIVHSPFGQILKAIRDNENRARSLGYDVQRYKMLAFVLSSGLAATAGGLKAIVLGLATLEDAGFLKSGEVVLMTLLGGIGTLFGPVVGAAILTGMQHYLAGLGAWVSFVQGAIFVGCVLAFRRGVMGELRARLEKQ